MCGDCFAGGRSLRISREIRCHTFQVTCITTYLKNGKLEIAQQMAAHESARATGLYDQRSDEVSLDKVERIGRRLHCKRVVIPG